MCQYWEDLYNLVNQYFINEQCMMLHNHDRLKKKVQNTGQAIGFYEKFTDMHCYTATNF